MYLYIYDIYILIQIYTQVYEGMRCIKVEDSMFENIVSNDTNDNIKVFGKMAHKYYIWRDDIFVRSNPQFKKRIYSSLNNGF